MVPSPAWKKDARRRKWRSIVAIFICVVLVFAAINGLLKGFSLKNVISSSHWDGKAPYVAAVGGKSAGFLIFQKEAKKIILVKLDNGMNVVVGNKQKPIVALGDALARGDGAEITNVLSVAGGVKLDSYILADKNTELNKETLVKNFKSFAAITTPIAILLRGAPANTNLTRYDALRLWWQAKSLGLNQLNFADLSGVSQEIIIDNNQKVLGVDDVSLRYQLSGYLKNPLVKKSNVVVEVEDRSGDRRALELAVNFITTVGFNVDAVSSADVVAKTSLVSYGADSYAVHYLARIFNCDIVGPPKGVGNDYRGDTIVLKIGSDFALKYFK